MKIIKVKSLYEFKDKKSLYINVEQIGHFYRVPEKMNSCSVKEVEHTIVGVTTHNNGGFKIVETPEELMEMISQYNK
jgi:hypothetical protein